MHTSSGVDNIDEYLETVTKKGDGYYLPLRHGGAAGRPRARSSCPTRRAPEWRRRNSPSIARITGPIVREADGKWVSVRLMQEPVKALTQSYMRTKAKNYKAFRETMELHTNSSNNTIYADADGNIAYFHSQLHPEARHRSSTGRKPVDGSDPATEWNGVLSIDETPERAEPADRLALQHQQLALVGGRPEQPEEGRLSGLRGHATARTRAASMPSACSTGRRTSRSTR